MFTERSFPPFSEDYPKLDLPNKTKPNLPLKTRLTNLLTRPSRHMMLHVEKMDVAITRAFLETGVSPDSHDIDGVTALALAVKKGHLQMAKLLLSRGADPNLPTGPDPEMPLHIAIVRKDIQMVELLLDNGANINAEASSRSCRNHNYRVEPRLIPSRLNNLTDCIWNGQTDMFRHLIRRGALYKEACFGLSSPYCNLDHHSSPFRSAIARNETQFIDSLMDLDVLEGYERRQLRCPHIDPLGLAMEFANMDLIRKFADLGMDMEKPFAPCSRLARLSEEPSLKHQPLTPLQYAQNLEIPSLKTLLLSLSKNPVVEETSVDGERKVS